MTITWHVFTAKNSYISCISLMLLIWNVTRRACGWSPSSAFLIKPSLQLATKAKALPSKYYRMVTLVMQLLNARNVCHVSAQPCRYGCDSECRPDSVPFSSFFTFSQFAIMIVHRLMSVHCAVHMGAFTSFLSSLGYPAHFLHVHPSWNLFTLLKGLLFLTELITFKTPYCRSSSYTQSKY